jgi:3-hydroxyisobutyrate dehydrogenase
MTIGFIGLGMMGYPMAHLLAGAGHSLFVHDISESVVERFLTEHAGAQKLDSCGPSAELDIVITMLPDSNAVHAAVLGTPDKPGIAESLRAGSVIIDMSSSEPLRSRELAATLAARGIDYLDAPVSGGVKRAVNGTLAIMVGGETPVIDRYRPVLEVMGQNITVVGKAGAGHAMKALNNYVSAAGLLAAVEALHVGQAFGLDPEAMTDVLNSSTGKNNTTENKVKQFMLSGAYNSGFSLALMAKDLGIAMGLGKSLSQPMELGDQLLALWRSANEQLGKGADHTEMYRFQENKT